MSIFIELLQSGKENVEGLSCQLMVPEKIPKSKKNNKLYLFFKVICKDKAYGSKVIFKGQKKNRKEFNNHGSWLLDAAERTLVESNIISE